MSTPQATPTTTNGSPRPRRAGLIVTGAVLAVVSLAALLGGGALVALHETQRDGDGYYASGHHPISTPTRALVSENLDVDTVGADWLVGKGRLAKLRVSASGTPSEPVFVGLARTDDVNAYLRGVSHETVTDFDLDPFSVEKDPHPGKSVPAPPASRRIWAASASGSGDQSVEWPVQKGDWSVVVMNADASPGVATKVVVGAKLGFFLWLGIAALIAGLAILAAGIAAIVAGRGDPPAPRPATPQPSATASEVTW